MPSSAQPPKQARKVARSTFDISRQKDTTTA